MRFLYSGCGERTKAAAHVGLGLFAAVCCVYNVAAFAIRHERHLKRNALFYALIVGVEVLQVRRHCARDRG